MSVYHAKSKHFCRKNAKIFYSGKISKDRKFSENIIVKSWKFSTSKYFSDEKFVSANHILQNFIFAENFPEWKTGFRPGLNGELFTSQISFDEPNTSETHRLKQLNVGRCLLAVAKLSYIRLGWFRRATHITTHKLLQVCKQVVTNVFTSCQQVVLVPSCRNKLKGIIRLVAKLF
jgi:hypothetical protein